MKISLADFEDVVILSVDYRYFAEKDRLIALLEPRCKNPRFFIDGEGEQLPVEMYNQLHAMPPETWEDGHGSYQNFRAFNSILRRARKNNFKNILIAEDDLILAANFDEQLSKVDMPDDWDMIYFGANHSGYKTHQVNENVLRCYGSTCTHLVAFRETIYDDALSLPMDRTFDWSVGNRLHDRYNCYAIFPSIAKQKSGYSHLWKKQVDYSKVWSSKGQAI